MIKINLLPFRAAQRRENVRRQLVIYVASVVLCALVCFLWYQNLSKELEKQKHEETRINNDLLKYKKTLAEIKNLEKRIKEVTQKLDAIKELEKGKTGPVLLLDEIAMAVPVNKLWLTALNESRGSLSLSGTAMDNETVALFMNNLEAAEHIETVDLIGTTLRNAQNGLKVSDFQLKCTTYAHKDKK